MKPDLFISLILTIVVSCTIPYRSAAQKEIRFERITVDDGLSQSSITSIVQDKFGYLWVSTLDGLNRYDGTKFNVYRNNHEDKNSLYNNRVVKLLLDKKQNIWIGYDNAISIYDPSTDQFTSYTFNENSSPVHVNAIDQLNDTVVLLATTIGVFELNKTTGKLSRSNEYVSFENRHVAIDYSTRSRGSVLKVNVTLEMKRAL
jgi:ligand-binding sensor domain-containing protein